MKGTFGDNGPAGNNLPVIPYHGHPALSPSEAVVRAKLLAARRARIRRNLKRLAILAPFAVLLGIVVALRLPRLEHGMATVMNCRISGSEMTVEYRMSSPFVLRLKHDELAKQSAPLITSQSISVGDFPSQYDFLRGEYFVRLRFSGGAQLTAEANGKSVEIRPWLIPNAFHPHWETNAHTAIADGCGLHFVGFVNTRKESESVDVYAISSELLSRPNLPPINSANRWTGKSPKPFTPAARSGMAD